MSVEPATSNQPRRRTLGVRRQHTTASQPTHTNGSARQSSRTSTAAAVTSPPANAPKRVGLSKRAPQSPVSTKMQQQLLVHQLSPIPVKSTANGSSQTTDSTTSAASSASASSTAAAALASITSSLDSFKEASLQSAQRTHSNASHNSEDSRKQQAADDSGSKRNKRRREADADEADEDDNTATRSQHTAAPVRPAQQNERPSKQPSSRTTTKRALDEREGQGGAEAEDEAEADDSDVPPLISPPPPRLHPSVADHETDDGSAATVEELDRVADINAALADMVSSEKPLSMTVLRKRLKVNTWIPGQLLIEYNAKGEVSVQAWRAIKRRLADKRRQTARQPAPQRTKQRSVNSMAEDGDGEDESEPEEDESEERAWDNIIDNLHGEDNRREEKMEEEVPPLLAPSSQHSNGQSPTELQSPRRKGGSTGGGGQQQPTAEDTAKLESINSRLIELKLQSGAGKMTQDKVRKLLQVNSYIIGPLLATFDKNGGRISMAQYMALKQQANNKRKRFVEKSKQDMAYMARLYQVSSSSQRSSSQQIQQHELDAIIASSQLDSLNGSQDSINARASRIPTGEPQLEELDKVAMINSVMGVVVASGEEVRPDDLRKRLHVGSHYSGPIEALYRQNGVVTVDDWRDLRRQQSERRSAETLKERQQAAAIEIYKKTAPANHRPSREERVEIRKREEEAAKQAVILKKQRAEEEAKRRVEVEAQKKREREEKAQRKIEAEAAKQSKDEAKLVALAKQRRPQADDDGLATESDSDRAEQERLEEERRNKMKRLEEKRLKLERDEDEDDWMSESRPKSKKPLSTAKADKAAATAAATAAKKEQELQTKVAELNGVMNEWEGSGRQWSRDEMRKHLKVGGDFPTMILAEWKAKGVLSMEGWRAMRKKVSAQRQARRRTLGDQAAPKPKSVASQSSETTDGTSSQPSHSSSSSSSSHTSTTHRKKLKRTDSDNDLSFHHSDSGTLTSTHRSLRRRTKVDYTAQLEEDPHTIVELTWYPTKADQPFSIVIDPIVPVIMDVHAHMADVEIIGVLAGQWLADRRLLWVQSAYPCQQVGTDDDLTNVEIDPASLISVQETAEGRGMRLVGWYHSHPYFRNQPSLVDVENQSRYQKMFGEAGSKPTGSSSSGSGGRHGMPFIGGIITPYGKGEFKPLPSSIKWFYNRERRGGGATAGDMPEEPMEMWTDIAEHIDDTERKQAAREVESYDELLARLRALCDEYGGVHGRVDFYERWQVGENNSGRRSTDCGDGADSLSGSQLSPSEVRRASSAATAADVHNKLDQFVQSVSAHLALVGRWKAASKQRLVDELLTAVGGWKGSGGQRTKQRKQQTDENGGDGGEETDTEGEEEDDAENDEHEEQQEHDEHSEEDEEAHEHDRAKKQRYQHEDSSDEMVADSQLFEE